MIDKTHTKCYHIYVADKHIKIGEKMQFVISNTQLSGLYHIIDEISHEIKQNKDANFIIVVPDKFSMNAEQIFMERTGLSSVFNVWITTLSRLVSKVVADSGNQFSLLTKNSGIMLVHKIIMDNADKISAYKKLTNNYSLAETMYNAINLLKSSGVLPEELKNNFAEDSFGLKIKDLYVVYSEYEKQMKNSIDTITRLQIFNQKVKNDEYIKHSKIYFAMFDSFTNIQIQSLCVLAKASKKFCLNLCANTHQTNNYIYDNTLFYRIKDFFDEEHVGYEILNIDATLPKQFDFLAKNMFAISQNNCFETDKIKLLESDTVENEARYVASRIKYLVMEQGYIFDDINVAVNGLGDYVNTISKIFDEYDLPFYIDRQRTMLDHHFVKTFLKIAKFVCGENTTNTAISIVKSPIFDISYQKKCDFENFCQKYGIFGDELFSKFNINTDETEQYAEEVRAKVFGGIKEFKENLNSASNVAELCKCTENYISKIFADNNSYFESQENDVLENRINIEANQKFFNVLNEASNMLGNAEMSKQMFFDMLESSLGAVNLLTVPLKCQAVFVGDASNNTYFPRKAMFVMGATQSRMPAYKTSAGAITDDEIDKFVSKKRISPTIMELNKREKFKLFNLLLLPSHLLELSYSALIGGEPQQKSEFVSALQKIITQNGKPLDMQKSNMMELEVFNSSNPKLPAYMVGTMQNAVTIANSKDSKIKYLLNKYFEDVLLEQKNLFQDRSDRFEIENAEHYIFPNKKTSVSQVEKYFKCPFLQFIDHTIKPKEQEKFEIKANIVGSILHKVAEIFVRHCIKNNFKIENTDALAKQIYKDVLESSDYKDFKSNKYFAHILGDEAVRFCKAIMHQIECSDFKPINTEFRFENYELENGIKFSGVVDRIDACDSINSVRIVDYKSGSDKFSFKDIYYGLKLQLLAYLKIIAEQFDKTPAGALYMPVKNKFHDLNADEFKSFKLDGVILDDVNMLKHQDKNLLENLTSDILPVALTKSGEINRKYDGHVLTNYQFDEITTYTFDVLTNAVDEMLLGYITPKPYVSSKNPCEFCLYKSLCHYEYSKKGFRELTKKDKYSFKKE